MLHLHDRPAREEILLCLGQRTYAVRIRVGDEENSMSVHYTWWDCTKEHLNQALGFIAAGFALAIGACAGIEVFYFVALLVT